jgi:hypothetical protein
MQDSRTTEMIKKGQDIIKKINNGELNISDMKAEPLPPMNQEGNLSHVSNVMPGSIRIELKDCIDKYKAMIEAYKDMVNAFNKLSEQDHEDYYKIIGDLQTIQEQNEGKFVIKHCKQFVEFPKYYEA